VIHGAPANFAGARNRRKIMRTQLLAATAILALSTAVAFAQTAVPSDQTTGQIEHGSAPALAPGQPVMPTGTMAGGTNPNWPTAPIANQTTGQAQRGTTAADAYLQTGTPPTVIDNSNPIPPPMPPVSAQLDAMPSAPPPPVVQAQAAPQPAPSPSMTPASSFVPGHEPMSAQASNINPADTHSEIAPALPPPPVGPDASANDLLQAAQTALAQHRSGAAQEALERAETRLLDRSTVPDAAGTPDQRPRVRAISAALDAIGRRDWPAAHAAIDAAMRPGPNQTDAGL
jgi:hypothetical protein